MGLNSTTSQVENGLGQPHGGRQHLERDVAHLSGQGIWQHHGSASDSSFRIYFPSFSDTPSPELRSVSILYVHCTDRAARNWDLPTILTPAPFPATPPTESGCSWVGHTHLGAAVSIFYMKLPCPFPLRLPTGRLVLEHL